MAQTAAGFLAGSFHITENGAASYTIPVAAPPGIAGIEPRIGLAFNSQGGNGLLGVGWGLQGLSVVERCPRTIPQDGARREVRYDTEDRYCIDGNRLLAISGPYGANGTEYRTEQASFARIVSYGAVGNGPASFQVRTKAGQIIEYGSSPDSRVQAQGQPSIRAWAVNRIADVKTNYLTIRYFKDRQNGSFYPTQIAYTGNSNTGLAPRNSVRFVAEPRPDVAPAYQGGSIIQNTVRLARIQTYVADHQVSEYRLSYEKSDAATQRSILASITQCDGAGACLAPLALQWQKPSLTGFQGWSWNSGSRLLADGSYAQVTDVNADGHADLVAVGAPGQPDAGVVYVGLGTGSGFQGWSWNSGSRMVADRSKLYFGDVNGDGRPDLVAVGAAGQLDAGVVYVGLNTGIGFQMWSWNSGFRRVADASKVYLADINADGRADMIAVGAIGKLDAGRVYVGLSTGSGFQGWSWSTTSRMVADYSKTYLVDVNADGRPDLVAVGAPGKPDAGVVYVGLNTGVGFQAWSWNSGVRRLADRSNLYFADVNADGRPDLVAVGAPDKPDAGVVYVGLNTGIGFQGWSWSSGVRRVADRSDLYFADVNSDGRDDLIAVGAPGQPDAGLLYVGLSLGLGFEGWSWNTQVRRLGDGSRCFFGDVNADGRLDLIAVGPPKQPGAGVVYTGMNDSPPLALQGFATPGFNLSVGLAYGLLTDGSVYKKDTGAQAASYPVLDLQVPIYAVSQVTSKSAAGTLTTRYQYGGLKIAPATGRGALGFRWIESTQVETGIVTRTEYRQDWPFVGLPALSQKLAARSGNNGLLGQTDFTYGCIVPVTGGACSMAPGSSYFTYASQVTERRWDISGAALPTMMTRNEYDAFGNATRIDVSSGDGYRKITTNTFFNDTSRWILSRLRRSTVQSITP